MHELIRVFGRIGLLSFGGPAAQIALMQKELTEERQWLDEAQFLRALSFCMLLPGPEAMQLATYAGWRLRGVWGGLIAGGLFVLPGAVVIAALAALYLHLGQTVAMQGLFLGVQATVVVIIMQALWRLRQKALKSMADQWIAVLAFCALFVFALPFPLVIALAGLWGAVRYQAAPSDVINKVEINKNHGFKAYLIVIFASLWAMPLLALALGGSEFLLTIGLFFSKMSLVSFGGAYALLAYMAQDVVNTHGWLSTTQMMDALGLAETTPGPLILVTQFVAHLSGGLTHGWGGFVSAGLLALWVTFIPCFLWIFAGAPLIEWLETQPRLSRALAAISAAVVGVMANLSLWFAIHLFFNEVKTVTAFQMHLPWPDLSTISLVPIGLCLLAGWLLWGRKLALPVVLAICAMAGLAVSLI